MKLKKILCEYFAHKEYYKKATGCKISQTEALYLYDDDDVYQIRRVTPWSVIGSSILYFLCMAVFGLFVYGTYSIFFDPSNQFAFLGILVICVAGLVGVALVIRELDNKVLFECRCDNNDK